MYVNNVPDLNIYKREITIMVRAAPLSVFGGLVLWWFWSISTDVEGVKVKLGFFFFFLCAYFCFLFYSVAAHRDKLNQIRLSCGVVGGGLRWLGLHNTQPCLFSRSRRRRRRFNLMNEPVKRKRQSKAIKDAEREMKNELPAQRGTER